MLQKSSIDKTIEIFFQEPTKNHYLMNISRTTNIAHTSIKNNLKQLEKEKLIKKFTERKGTRIFPLYKAILENKEFKRYKQIYNLKSIKESKIIEYIEEKLTPNSIILFGSFERGEDTEESDIDLYLETKKQEINLKKFEKKLNRKIQLHFKEHFTKYPKELKNNIINGITLSGFLEGYK
jgi:predicted nucleotidyltransferase